VDPQSRPRRAARERAVTQHDGGADATPR